MGTGQTGEPVVLGPNTVIDLPEGASFQFVEILARSLAEHRAWLESLDQAMRRDALIPAAALVRHHRRTSSSDRWISTSGGNQPARTSPETATHRDGDADPPRTGHRERRSPAAMAGGSGRHRPGDGVAPGSADRNAAEGFASETPVDIEVALQAEDLGDIQPLRERHQGEIGEIAG